MTDLAVVLQSITVKDDKDEKERGPGEIYINYNITDGSTSFDGQLGEYSIHSGQTKSLGVTIGTFSEVDTLLALNVDVYDADWPDADDHLGNVNVSYGPWDLGTGIHTVATEDYDLTFSIVPI